MSKGMVAITIVKIMNSKNKNSCLSSIPLYAMFQGLNPSALGAPTYSYSKQECPPDEQHKNC